MQSKNLVLLFSAFFIIGVSCKKSPTITESQEENLLIKMGVNVDYDSLKYFKEEIKARVKPIYFSNIEEATIFFKNCFGKNLESRLPDTTKNAVEVGSELINFAQYNESLSEMNLPDCNHGNMYNSYSPNYFNGYFVSFEYNNMGPSGYGLSNVASGLIGFTFGVGWTHLNSSSFTTINGVIHYTIYGIQNYYIVIDGVGTFFSQPVTIQGYYQPCTGAGRITSVTNTIGGA